MLSSHLLNRQSWIIMQYTQWQLSYTPFSLCLSTRVVEWKFMAGTEACLGEAGARMQLPRKAPRLNASNLRSSLIQQLANVTTVAYAQTPRLTLHSHTQGEHKTPCLSSAHLESSAPPADSSKSSPASPRPHYSRDSSPSRPRAKAATHTVTPTTRLPDGSSA